MGVSQGLIGDPKRWYAAVKMGQGARSWRVGYVGGWGAGWVDDDWKKWCSSEGFELEGMRHVEWV